MKNLLKLSINLNTNNIEKEGAQYIGSEIKDMKNLLKLNIDLNNNNIGNEGA